MVVSYFSCLRPFLPLASSETMRRSANAANGSEFELALSGYLLTSTTPAGGQLDR